MYKNLSQALMRPCRCFFSVLLLATTFAVGGPAFAQAAAPALKVAFVYVSPVGEAGWTYQHEQGRLAMEKALAPRIRTTRVESVAEGADAERVIRDLAAQGHQLIFATSFGYLEPTLRVAREFPHVKFEHAGGYKTAPNVNTYNARYYEARYLAGMLAGQASKSGVAGYVAGFPVPEVVQGINAFALGMRAVNPKASVRIVWLDAWFDPAREREAAQALIDQGADVLTNHSGSTAVAQTAEANFKTRGVRFVAYQSDMAKFAPRAQLAAIVHQWGGYYTRVAQALLDGAWKAEPTWGGLREGLVALTAIDPMLAQSVRESVEQHQRAIVDGRFSPFSGRLMDNTGQQRLAAGTLPDTAIAQMNWFVDGVVGAVPKP